MPEAYSHLAHANDVEPSAGHQHLRERCPLHIEESHDPPFFVLSRHADVFDVLMRPSEWRNGYGVGIEPSPPGVLGTTDDPDHRRHRRVLQDTFRPAALARLDDDVDEIAEELWTRAFGDDGEGDFVPLFVFPFPAVVIAALLGVPRHRRDEFGRWSDDIVNFLGGGDPAKAEAANREIFVLVDELVADRIAAHERGDALPDDVLSVMAVAEIDGELTHHEVRRLSQQLLVAGHETTASLISLMLYRLIERPDLVGQLRSSPELIPSAVEEFLRFDSPVQGLFRTNPEPSRSVTSSCRRAHGCRCCSPRRIVTPTCSTTRTRSGSTGSVRAPGPIWPSAGACTTASARRWPAGRVRSPCASWSTGSTPSSARATSPSTTRSCSEA